MGAGEMVGGTIGRLALHGGLFTTDRHRESLRRIDARIGIDRRPVVGRAGEFPDRTGRMPGGGIVDRERVVQHEILRARDLVEKGETVAGLPVRGENTNRST